MANKREEGKILSHMDNSLMQALKLGCNQVIFDLAEHQSLHILPNIVFVDPLRVLWHARGDVSG